jgi:hypothetical protein
MVFMQPPLSGGVFSRRPAGETLVEAAVAIATVGSFVAALSLMGSSLLALLRSANDGATVNQAMQERVEQMRIANFLQITDASYLQGALAAGSDSAKNLNSPTETITVSAYPAKAGSTPVQITRTNAGAQIVTSNPDLQNEKMVRVDISLAWKGFPRNRPRLHATTALIAKGGMAK